MHKRHRPGSIEADSFASEDAVVRGLVRGQSVVIGRSHVDGVVDSASIVSNATIPSGAAVEQAVILESAGVMCGSIGGRTWCAYTRWTGEWRVYIHIGCQQLFLDQLTEHVILDFAQQFSVTDTEHFECMIHAIANLARVGIKLPTEPFDRMEFLAQHGVPQEQFA